MDTQTAQAFADFERFLTGASAPALVGHALATVVRNDVKTVAATVVRRAYADPGPRRLQALLAARDKVYDIFFYRIVRFRRVYEFFPRFERALVEAVPAPDREAVVALLRQYPWQDIRPIGRLQDPREFALEVRPSASVSSDSFNEDIYRNATHEILSADRRYSFDDPSVRDNVAESQAMVTEVFDDFVSLIKDAILRREIMQANEADRDVVYANQPRFQIESYVAQLADLAVALFNDDFLEHSVQTFGVMRTLAAASGIDVESLQHVHAKSELVNRQRLADYSASRTGPLLLRSVLPIFPQWRPERLLEVLRDEEDAKEREFALTVLAAYGRDVYGLVVDALERCPPTASPHFRRDLAYLLGHLATDQVALRARAVSALASHFRRDAPQQVNAEIVSALSAIRTDPAVDALVAKLAQFAPEFGTAPEATDVCNRVIAALLEARTDAALAAAVDFCVAHDTLDRHADEFAAVALPAPVRASLVAAVRKEARKLKLSFSLLGNANAARSRLLALGSAAQPEVGALCAEISSAFPATHDLALAAARLRDIPPPSPRLEYDRAFHRLLEARDLPEALSYAFEAGLSGRVEIETQGGIDGEVWLRKGDVWHATVPSLFSKQTDAFYWMFALEPGTVAWARFTPAPPPSDARTLDLATPELIRDGLFRAKHVQQTIASILSPESRFRRRRPEFPEQGFSTTGQLGPFKAVWICLASPVDIKTIEGATGLSEHEIYRVLFDLLRQNLLDVETGAVDRQLATIDDALTALGLFLRRIAAHPTYFQSYQSAAEVCAYLSNEVTDETIRSAAWALHTYLLTAFNLRRVFAPQNVDFCEKVLAMLADYLRTGSDADRRELLEYLDIYLPEEERWPAPAQDEETFIQSILEQIENIDGGNDPFDAAVAVDGPTPAEVVSRTLDGALAAQSAEDGGAIDVRTPGELLADSAGFYVKPLRDFVREVERDLEAHRETSSAWLGQASGTLETLLAAAGAAGETELREALSRLERAVHRQRQTGSDVLTPAFCGYVLTEYRRLAEILPSAFAVSLEGGDLELKKRTLLLKFLLRQVPEVDDLAVNKVLAAGFNTFEDVAETPPDDLARASGLPRKLADKIFMKIYQYEDLYYHPDEPQAHAKLLAFYAINLNVLKELHASVERLSSRADADPDRKRQLIADRQRALWGIFALLCLKNSLDLIERLQKTVFEQRIAMLETHFAALSAEPFPSGRRRLA
jgi:hypothetical protein